MPMTIYDVLYVNHASHIADKQVVSSYFKCSYLRQPKVL